MVNKCDDKQCRCDLPPYIMRLMDAAMDLLDNENTGRKLNKLRLDCHAVLSDFRDDYCKDRVFKQDMRAMWYNEESSVSDEVWMDMEKLVELAQSRFPPATVINFSAPKCKYCGKDAAIIPIPDGKPICESCIYPKPTYCKSCRSYYYAAHICPVQVKDIVENAKPSLSIEEIMKWPRN